MQKRIVLTVFTVLLSMVVVCIMPSFPRAEDNCTKQDNSVCNNEYLLPVVVKNKLGFANRQGKIIRDAEYDLFKYPALRDKFLSYHLLFYPTNNANEESDYDNNSRVTIIPKYIRGHLPVGKNDKIGIINQYGKLVVPVEYERVMFCDVYFCVRDFNKKVTMFSYGGKLLCTGIDDFQPLSEGLIAVKKDGKWGYIDVGGNVVMPFLFDDAMSFQYGIAEVKREKRYYKIDRNGNELTDENINNDKLLDGDIEPNNRYEVKPFQDSDTQLWGVIDSNAKVIIKPQYASLNAVVFRKIPYFFVTSTEPKRFGLIDFQGNYILPIIYTNIFSRDSDSTLKVMTVDGKQGLFHLSGYWILPVEYNDFGNLSESLRWVCLGNKFGYVDEVGTLVIPTKYDWAEDFQNGVAAVGVGTTYFAYELQGGKWGYIDHAGNWIWNPNNLSR